MHSGDVEEGPQSSFWTRRLLTPSITLTLWHSTWQPSNDFLLHLLKKFLLLAATSARWTDGVRAGPTQKQTTSVALSWVWPGAPVPLHGLQRTAPLSRLLLQPLNSFLSIC